ncbi:Putative esterase, FIGfam005057 [hydrothermal vent metagenome]|uniref:Putative esterase, FIGfam005057 n=1 Tax=hydrothermal vent metagenome TaxID=652676 RepID=A0A1W1EHQ6_9ZZZZ
MILYIHGFASSSKSNKVTLMRNSFDNIKSIDLNIQPKVAITQLEEFIEDNIKDNNITLIGSSLGGFYALYLSQKYNLKAVLINPSIYPYKTLKVYKNQNITNYSSGKISKFKKKYLTQLKNYRVKNIDNSKILLLLQMGDKTIDYREALRFLPNSKYIIESGGNHQFENFEDYFAIISRFIKE